MLETNDPPTISGLNTSYTLAENTVDIASVVGTDPEGSSVSFSVTGTDSSSIAISSSGELTFAVVSNFEAPADTNSDNVYEFNVNVSDGSNVTSQEVTITITGVDEAPEFNFGPAISIDENVIIDTTVVVADPEGDSFSVSMSGADSDLFDFNTNTLRLFLEPVCSLTNLGDCSDGSADHEIPTDADTNNIYELTFTATENSSSGLTNLISTTVALIFSEASSAISSIFPKAKIAVSFPVLTIFPFPSSIVESETNSSISDFPLGNLTQTGPSKL